MVIHMQDANESGEGRTVDERTDCELLLAVMPWRNGGSEKRLREAAKLICTEPRVEAGTVTLVGAPQTSHARQASHGLPSTQVIAIPSPRADCCSHLQLLQILRYGLPLGRSL